MSLRALKSLARTPPGHLQCSKQCIGVEKRLSATYLPLNLDGSGTDIGRDDLLTRVSSQDSLEDAGMGGSLLPNPIPCTAVSDPLGRPFCSLLNSGDELSADGDYSFKKVLDLRDDTSLNSH